MSKTIKFTHNEEEYILEYTRASIVKMEGDGYSMSDMQTKPFTMLPLLFKYAFYAHHKKTSDKKIKELYNLFTNKQDLVAKLAEMISDTFETLFEEPEEKNAIKWETNF